MSNLSCAPPTDVDRLRRLDFQLSLLAGFIITGATFYYAFLALRLIWKTPIYEMTAKLLMSQLMVFCVITRFRVSSRFQNRQAIETTNTICILSLFSSIFLFIYTVGIFVLLAVRPSISPFVFNSFVTYVYTIPFVAFMIPRVILYRIRATRRSRVHALNEFAHAKQTQDEHINELKIMWS